MSLVLPVRLSLSDRSRSEPSRSALSARSAPRHAATMIGVRPTASVSPDQPVQRYRLPCTKTNTANQPQASARTKLAAYPIHACG